MKLLWEYPLPPSAQSRDYHYAGPILAHQEQVYYAGNAEPALSTHGRRRDRIRLHRVDRATGSGEWTDFEVRDAGLPGSWSLTLAGEQVWFHGSAFIAGGGEPVCVPGPAEGALAPEKQAARPAPLLLGTRLVYANDTTEALESLDIYERRVVWSQSLEPVKPYRAANPLPFGELIACYGRKALLILDPASGEVLDEIRIPRVDKLYSPIPDGDDLLLGYTNWSTAGILRYHRPTRKVLWQYRRKFEGPNSYCRIWRVGDVVVWVKGETELIGVDAATGEERWRTWASPYLYSRVTVIGTDLLFGTAGRGGAVQVIDGLTGELRWSRSLNDGCEYYALDGTSVFVGDFDGFVRRLDLRSGEELARLSLGTEVVGDIALDGDRLYTVAWPDEDRPPRLVCVGLESSTTFG